MSSSRWPEVPSPFENARSKMIAVAVPDADRPVVAEFFELFKTPWEFYGGDSDCDVLVCAGTEVPRSLAALVIIYDSEPVTFDKETGAQVCSRSSGASLRCGDEELPIFGSCLGFVNGLLEGPIDKGSNAPVIFEFKSENQRVIRIGYRLFEEVRFLLTRGQPPSCAQYPTVELHIALLRGLILSSSIPLVEIPAAPLGHEFIACLTHDVDHVGIRNHKVDHTLLGFVYRATFGSSIDLLTGRKSLRQLGRNWAAVLSLPLVHLGIVRDFWFQFDRYTEIENGCVSTYFVIPKKGDSGCDANGRRPRKRAARYDLAEIASDIRTLQSAGREIGVHGIDAWRDSNAGQDELARVSHFTGTRELGVRMHWLYFDEQSPAILERAGFSYDSTVGYNETVGYRAGAAQVFKPLQTVKMLELPMHIMDTALFYPSYLNLSPKQAEQTIRPFIENAARFGGVLTINWHDRSIAPERLWDGAYAQLLNELKMKNAWFATAGQSVGWFKKRRAVHFQNVSWENGKVRMKATADSPDGLPGLRLRIYKRSMRKPDRLLSASGPESFVDVPLADEIDLSLAA
jgi:hypothetical protein